VATGVFAGDPVSPASVVRNSPDLRECPSRRRAIVSRHERTKSPTDFALLKSKGQWFNPQPWLFTFLRGSNAEQVAGEILRGLLSGEDIGPFCRITYYPMLTGAFRTRLVRLPEDHAVFPFNLVRIPATNEAAMAEQMLAGNRALYDRIRGAGGVLYPVSAFPMSSDDWREHFGSRWWPLLVEARRRYDPANLLTPGYDLF
jgi:cytokinin dehydrogenase